MKGVIVRYKVKADQAAENEELVRAVYDELIGRTQPAFATRPSGWTEKRPVVTRLTEIGSYRLFGE